MVRRASDELASLTQTKHPGLGNVPHILENFYYICRFSKSGSQLRPKCEITAYKCANSKERGASDTAPTTTREMNLGEGLASRLFALADMAYLQPNPDFDAMPDCTEANEEEFQDWAIFHAAFATHGDLAVAKQTIQVVRSV